MDEITPSRLAGRLVRLVVERYASPGDRYYEPFMGDGAFFSAMPEPKDWAEIRKGRDFFSYLPFDGHCEHIITNPPFKTIIGGEKRNAYIPILERCMEIATKTVGLLINHRIFNALTPVRLERYARKGWTPSLLLVVSVRKWFGRYYFIVFSRDHPSVMEWWTENF